MISQAESRRIFDSSSLAYFRDLVLKQESYRSLLGEFIEYKVVIDANFVIGDLLHKAKRPDIATTALEEVIASGTVKVHAPRWLDKELVESALPNVATKRKVDLHVLLNLWIEYKEKIVFDESLDEACAIDGVVDSKDIPYLELERKMLADGILSKDRHIEAMGGNKLTFEFVLSARDYARNQAVLVNVKYGGLTLGSIAIQAIEKLISAVASVYSRIPDTVKYVALGFIVAILIHPQSREAILRRIREYSEGLANLFPMLEELAMNYEKHRELALQAENKLDRHVAKRAPEELES